MTLEGLLAFFAIVVGALTIARPVQRRSLNLFFPTWRLLVAVLISFCLIVLRDAPYGVPPPWGWSPEKALYWLQVSAFLVPVMAGLWGWGAWRRARLNSRRMRRVEDVFRAALREREFDEVERIVQRNLDHLHRLPASAVTVLFSPPMVSALMQAQSLVHLELLADLTFLTSLSNRYQAVDVAVRELLRSEISPMRPAVFTQFGGLEHITYSDDERRLMESTFESPEWYYEAGAHYPLVIAAVEALRSGALDREYNEAGDHYETSQGVSRRAHCPVFLAEKTEVLALQSVIRHGVERDFYVTDLLDIFRAVQERSRVSEAWSRPLKERPTPFAYLLYEIGSDLSDLSGEALQKAVSETQQVQEVAKPGSVANALAMTWSFCVWNIADSEKQVSDDFRTSFIRSYLVFILRLGWQPNEVSFGLAEGIRGLDAWRDLFLDELKKRFVGDHHRRDALLAAFKSLDGGKRYVREGSDWLKKQLSL